MRSDPEADDAEVGEEGIDDLRDVELAVLEPDGNFSFFRDRS